MTVQNLYRPSISVIMLFAALLLSQAVSAHSPSSMDISYDDIESVLTLEITHQVADPTTHYVNRISVRLNNEERIVEEYTSQPTSSTFQYTYDLEAVEGDELFAAATCNQGGTISKTVMIGPSTEPDDDGSTADNTGEQTPGFGLISVMAMLALALLIYKKR